MKKETNLHLHELKNMTTLAENPNHESLSTPDEMKDKITNFKVNWSYSWFNFMFCIII